jgi:methyl-accepting chemotaxis protein
MTSPELARRVDRQAEDLRAISDTVLDIKETVGQHTETLAQQIGTLADHGRELAAIKGTLADHGRQLGEILALLRQGR